MLKSGFSRKTWYFAEPIHLLEILLKNMFEDSWAIFSSLSGEKELELTTKPFTSRPSDPDAKY